MRPKRKFRAIIEDAGSGGAFVTVPFDGKQVFGKKRVKVKATMETEVYRGSLVRMGGACHVLGIRKDIREKLGTAIGDTIEIAVEEDTEPREVIVPADFRKALKTDPKAGEFYERLSYSHQKEYVRWIEEAKRAETRKTRIDRALFMLARGKKERG